MIRFILRVYIVILLIRFIADLLPQFREHPWVMEMKKFTDFSTQPLKRFMPPDLPVDVTPIILAALIEIFIRIF